MGFEVGPNVWTTEWEKLGASIRMRPALIGNGRSAALRERSALLPASDSRDFDVSSDGCRGRNRRLSQLAFGARVVLVEIAALILDAAPQPFAEDVFEGAGATVHVDMYVGIGRELCALVGVEDLGPTLAESLAQGIETEDTVQGVG